MDSSLHWLERQQQAGVKRVKKYETNSYMTTKNTETENVVEM